MWETGQPAWKQYFAQQEEGILARPPTPESELDKQARLLAEKKKMMARDGAQVRAEQAGARARGKWKVVKEAVAVSSKWWREERNQRRVKLGQGQLALEDLNLGVPTTGSVAAGEYRYYRARVPAADAILTVNMRTLEGDPDLFVSTVTVPTVVDYTWKSSAVGEPL